MLIVLLFAQYEYHNPADNIALAIYRDADSAQQALNASPIRFALEKVAPNDENTQYSELEIEDEDQIIPQTPTKDGIEEILRPSQLVNRTLSHTDLTTRTSSPDSEGNPRSPFSSSAPPMPFQEPSAPKDTISKWFQVTVDRSRVVHQDFVERQPYWKQFTPMKSMAQEDLAKKVPHIGLSDVSKRPPHAHRTPNKVLKMMSHYVENRMPSLVDMYEEGARETKGQKRP